MATGNFFAVDRSAWAAVCGKGMNPATAYLVLACFSGRDNRTTSASVNAVEQYTGIARGRARQAIDALISIGRVRQRRGGTRPQYAIDPYTAKSDTDWIWLPNALVTGVAQETCYRCFKRSQAELSRARRSRPESQRKSGPYRNSIWRGVSGERQETDLRASQ